ncbi:MAG: HEAT repeat domain-containing protein [Promethearchaeota archaeon]
MISNKDTKEMEDIQEIVKEGRIDDAVKKIGEYLNQSTEEDYIERMENVIETILKELAGRTVLRFLIEHLIIDIPYLLKHLSKKDSFLRYSFLLLLKSMCENEADLFFPYAEELLNSEDPNVREALLQLLIFIEGGNTKIEDEKLLMNIGECLNDEKDFVVNKAIQLLKIIGNKSPSLITRMLTNYLKNHPDNDALKEKIDNILKAIVSVEKIDEILEEEPKTKEEELIEEEVGKIEHTPQAIEEKEEEEKIIKIEEETKKTMTQSEETIVAKKDIVSSDKKEREIKDEQVPDLKSDELKQREQEIKEKELELKKKELELKKKKLEIEAKEKALEEKELKEKEEALRHKEELLEREKMLAQVELELKKKELEDKERKLVEQEKKRIEEKLKKENL